ncbi:BamA/TamA family outer membrane protein [Williamwhitmania taraxaci]|uniref:Outer membrane protein assembly factor BamA n=1 Tax=Williamwhitmania taraxaci TaxID=1640674 RepID=A0A1G6H325_9BACT|nr:hypothetical protein [Williamwhitmania taraxaci]SDB88528.1 hypothetical protein SAMN05216323_100641 [Williamwhitmania taraxaci]
MEEYFKILATALLWLLFPYLSLADNADTLRLRAGQTLVTAKGEKIIKVDTLVVMPDSVDFIVVNSGENKKNFFDKVGEKTENRRFLNQVYRRLVKSTEEATEPNREEVVSREEELSHYAGKPIRSIIYERQELFRVTKTDTAETSKRLKRIGNNLHVYTRRYILEKNTLLKKGDIFDPILVAENEQLLRSLSFISEARIWVFNTPSADSIDLCISTRDVWSKAFHLEVSDPEKGRVDLFDNNILGFGQEFQSSIYYNYTQNNNLGFKEIYTINNLWGKFINTTLSYQDAFDDRYISGSATRNFSATALKYAGGLSAIKRSRPYYSFDFDSTYIINSHTVDAWIGRTFVFNAKNKYASYRKQLALAARITRYGFTTTLPTDASYNLEFHKRTTTLGSISFSTQKFYQNRLVYGFGRTEDISQGLKLQLIGGYEVSKYTERTYVGATVSTGKLYAIGYNQIKVSFGSYLRNGNMEQGALRLDFNCFSNLWQLGIYRIRQFVNLNYTSGINQLYGEGESISLSGKDGVRGLSLPDINGNQRLNIAFETVLFTPYSPIDFKTALYAFADMGFIGQRHQSVFDGINYTGFGIGIRVRNENLVFRTLQIRLAFYPYLPVGAIPKYIDISGVTSSRFENFYPTPPTQIPLQ